MVFYLLYPDQKVDLGILWNICHQRLAILMKIARCEGNVDAVRDVLEEDNTCHECLIEGTPQDSVSHFILRSLLCLDLSIFGTVAQAESMLFLCRFEALNWHERRAILERAASDCGELLKCKISRRFRELLRTLSKVLHAVLDRWRDITEAKEFRIGVPFEHALPLVSNRRVVLRRGEAIIQEHHLATFLAGMFEATCSEGAAHFRQSATFRTLHQDERMVELRRSLNGAYDAHRAYLAMGCKLSAGDVDSQAAYFPPCMSKLYATLRKDKRLPHDDRFVFSLFLKEIGLDLAEAIEFWSQFYIAPPGKDAKCTHSWQAHTSRLTYSVRHMYGQEGRRIDYTAHRCAQVQGHQLCPFTTGRLLELPALQAEDIEDIGQLCENRQYLAACRNHMLRRGKQLASEMDLDAELFDAQESTDDSRAEDAALVGINKPSRFYFYMKKFTKQPSMSYS